MTRGDKMILGGAFGLGILAAYSYLKKGGRSLFDPYGAYAARQAASGSGGGGYAPAPGYRAPPAPTAKAAPVPSSQGGDAPSVPAEDPSTMVASFGDTPAVPAGGWYDSPPGG